MTNVMVKDQNIHARQSGTGSFALQAADGVSDWYVVRTVPRGEYLAADELRRDDFEVLLPRAKTPNLRTGYGYVPLFPGYLFLRCDVKWEAMPSLTGLAHVLGWLNFGGIVAPLPDGYVEQLMQRLESLNEEGGLWRRFQPGEKVRIVGSGIENLAEVVEEAKSPQARVKVLMEFMGRLVSAHVPRENLQSIEDEGMEGEGMENYWGPRRTRGKGRWVKGFGARAAASV